MPVFALYLEQVGENRAKVMLVIKEACKLPFDEVKVLLASARPRLMIGPKWQLAAVQKQLISQGASATVEFYPEGIDVSRWARRVSKDGIHCSVCSAKLFFAVPKLTTTDQIVEFALQSTIANAAEVARTGWIHPGVYCPNGCDAVMANLGDIN